MVGDLFKYWGFAHSALAVNDQDVVDEASAQVLLNPIEYILTAEEHARLDHRCSRDVWIEKIIHRSNQIPQIMDLLNLDV